jgi:hypothetical protein
MIILWSHSRRYNPYSLNSVRWLRIAPQVWSLWSPEIVSPDYETVATTQMFKFESRANGLVADSGLAPRVVNFYYLELGPKPQLEQGLLPGP